MGRRSTSTSAAATSSCRRRRPSAAARSAVTLRLPRSHSGDAASARKRSPPGRSTLTTSAPKSARTIVAMPPTGPVVASTTRTPSNTWANTSGTAATVLAGPSAVVAGARQAGSGDDQRQLGLIRLGVVVGWRGRDGEGLAALRQRQCPVGVRLRRRRLDLPSLAGGELLVVVDQLLGRHPFDEVALGRRAARRRRRARCGGVVRHRHGRHVAGGEPTRRDGVTGIGVVIVVATRREGEGRGDDDSGDGAQWAAAGG